MTADRLGPEWTLSQPECGSPAVYDGVELTCQAPPGHADSHIAELDGEPYFWGLDR
jgi:hypothetical protein